MNKQNNYIIKGGTEGKSRLKTLSQALYPYTISLLEKAGLQKGMSFLDLGCGGGDVSFIAAQITGESGEITGIDFDSEIIKLAAEDASFSGLNHVSFKTGSAYEIVYKDHFDMAYSRFLFSHLAKPMDVLKKMYDAVKPGGMVIVEDTHFSGHVCYPPNEAFSRYVNYFMKAAFNNGHDPEIGPSLFSLFQKAGFEDIKFDVILPCFNEGPGKWMAYLTLDRIKKTLIDQNIANAEDISGMLAELKTYTEDPATIMSLPHIFRVWGKKKQ